MTKRQEGFIPRLHNWFVQMERQDQESLLNVIEQGDGALQQWLDENAIEEKESFLELLQLTSEYLKENNEEKVLDMLDKMGFKAIELAEALVHQAQRELRFYVDASALRAASLEQFESIAAKVIVDFFVERRYFTWEKRGEFLGLDDQTEVRGCYTVIVNLIHNFYDQEISLELLESFIIEELGMTVDKAGRFTELIVRSREALDRHFLFRRLSKLAVLMENNGMIG